MISITGQKYIEQEITKNMLTTLMFSSSSSWCAATISSHGSSSASKWWLDTSSSPPLLLPPKRRDLRRSSGDDWPVFHTTFFPRVIFDLLSALEVEKNRELCLFFLLERREIPSEVLEVLESMGTHETTEIGYQRRRRAALDGSRKWLFPIAVVNVYVFKTNGGSV